jgi:hypothetical protein
MTINERIRKQFPITVVETIELWGSQNPLICLNFGSFEDAAACFITLKKHGMTSGDFTYDGTHYRVYIDKAQLIDLTKKLEEVTPSKSSQTAENQRKSSNKPGNTSQHSK